MKLLSALAAAATLVAVSAPAAADRGSTDAGWAKHPGPSDLEAFYPKAAREAEVEGRVEIECIVETDGAVTGCKVVSESPEGWDFGAATLKAVPVFQMKPATKNGRPIAHSVRIPINWSLDDDPAMSLPPLTWARRPTEAELASVYPEIAAALRLGGEATLRCATKADGALGACQVEDEDPSGLGFGDAALKLKEAFRIQADKAAALEGTLAPVRVSWTPSLLPSAAETAYEAGAPAEFAGDWVGKTGLFGPVEVGLHLRAAPEASTLDNPAAFMRGVPLKGMRRHGRLLLVDLEEGSTGTLVLEPRDADGAMAGKLVSRLDFGFDAILEALSDQERATTPTEPAPVLVLELELKPGVATPIAPSQRKRSQTPVPPYPYLEETVAVDAAPHVRLAGTLTLPKGPGPHPAVLLIQGSGPQNRDYTQPSGHRMFSVLADDLTRRGVAVLRLDKRGVGESTGNFGATTHADQVADIRAALAFLRARPDIAPGRTGVIGHSEGALLAVDVAAEDPALAFTVLLGGVGVEGDKALLAQARRRLVETGAAPEDVEALVGMQAKLYAVLKRGGDDRRLAAEAFALMKDPQIQAWMKELSDRGTNFSFGRFTLFEKQMAAYDPGPQLRRIHTPVLAVTGGKDLLTPADIHLPGLRTELKGVADTQIVELPGLNHGLQTAVTGAPDEMVRIEETIAPAALTLIGEWVAKRAGAPQAARP